VLRGVERSARDELAGATFRADGTAVSLWSEQARNAFLLDYASCALAGDPKTSWADRVTFQDLQGLTASVRLR